MKVYVKEQKDLSRAMARVSSALQRFAPKDIQIVTTRDEAEIVVLHVIGFPETEAAIREIMSRGQQYALIMYCLRSTQKPSTIDWLPLWKLATCVWSYYNLKQELCQDGVSFVDFPFYHAPLGVDDHFRESFYEPISRDIGVMTSGYVSGPSSEAIEEVAVAAMDLGLDVVHLGPKPEGLTRRLVGRWKSVHEISDKDLAQLYRRSRWVSGLRHVEGFELPALEGLCCGARPILFYRPDMWSWYGDHAEYVPECSGDELIDRLKRIFVRHPDHVRSVERNEILEKFDWKNVINGFWETARIGKMI